MDQRHAPDRPAVPAGNSARDRAQSDPRAFPRRLCDVARLLQDAGMTSATVEPVVDEFLSRQRAMYAGGSTEPVAEMLADCVVWHVPGTSPIAGDHVGREEVLAYFRRRRELAGGGAAGRQARRDRPVCGA